MSLLGHCYFLTSADTWTNTEANCRAEGSHLATINSAVESNTLAAWYNYQNIWIGMHRPNPDNLPISCSPSLYTWVDGSPTVYTNWASGQPDCGLNIEACGHLWASSVWNDQNCNNIHPGICKIATWAGLCKHHYMFFGLSSLVIFHIKSCVYIYIPFCFYRHFSVYFTVMLSLSAAIKSLLMCMKYKNT